MKDRTYYTQLIAELDARLRCPNVSKSRRKLLEDAREFALRKIAEMEYFENVISLN